MVGLWVTAWAMAWPKHGSSWSTLRMETVMFLSVGFNCTEQSPLKQWFLYTYLYGKASGKAYNKQYMSLSMIHFSLYISAHTHTCIYTKTLYLSESNTVAFTHIIYTFLHESFQYSLLTTEVVHHLHHTALFTASFDQCSYILTIPEFSWISGHHIPIYSQ